MFCVVLGIILCQLVLFVFLYLLVIPVVSVATVLYVIALPVQSCGLSSNWMKSYFQCVVQAPRNCSTRILALGKRHQETPNDSGEQNCEQNSPDIAVQSDNNNRHNISFDDPTISESSHTVQKN